MELKECINFLLTTAQHNVFQLLSVKLAEYDVTPSQYGVLSCLWGRTHATPKQIAETLCLETSTISGVLDRMQKKDLIDRVINKEDRREVQVIITEKGKALEEPISKIIDDVNAEVLKDFKQDEVLSIKKALREIAGYDFA
ncbi:MAG: MarR family winged helix-turn-helix transcriptional regulator [Anaerotignaceae bacterium]